jgi:hypothetical protein
MRAGYDRRAALSPVVVNSTHRFGGRSMRTRLPLDISRREAFSMDQTPLDFSVLAKSLATIEEFVPALTNSTVREHRAGLFTMTADGHFIAALCVSCAACGR